MNQLKANLSVSLVVHRTKMAQSENIYSNNTTGHCDKRNLTPIQRFFDNSSVFLTGGTGFLGMLLLEKLLTSCPGIFKIYLLVRNKKGKDVQTRMDEFFDDDVFSRLKTQCPNFREKIVAVEGDCELPMLGLTAQDKETLIREVNVVFHGAATVRFDEAIKKASIINVRAVRDMIELARQIPNLKSFIHISTAYSNCIHNFIKEEIYPPAMDFKKLLDVTESLPDDMLATITKPLLGDFPNTYSFTKQIGEDVVRREGKGMPLGVHRPSIVISTYKEPLRGWINNLYGPTGMITGGGVGVIRATQINPEINGNLVPADMVVNSIVASAWDVAENLDRNDFANGVPVYNFEISRGPNLTWDVYITKCVQIAYKYFSVKSIWYLVDIRCRTRLSYVFIDFFVHKVPAFLMDAVRFCLGKPPMMMKVYKKIDKMENVLNYFKMRQWEFESKNVEGLLKRMSEEDRSIFSCDVKDLDWDEYLEYYVRGIRIYLIKDPLETIEEGQKYYRRFYWLHQMTKIAAVAFCLWILWSILSLIFKYVPFSDNLW